MISKYYGYRMKYNYAYLKYKYAYLCICVPPVTGTDYHNMNFMVVSIDLLRLLDLAVLQA